VDLDRFDENAREIAARAGGKKIRIASKSIRCVALIQRILGSNPIYQGVMAYSGREALHLSRHGLNDLLVAYPIWGEAQIEAVIAAAAEGKTITLMVDCAEHARHLAEIAKRRGGIVSVCIDLDMSSDYPGLHFGVRRSPVRTVAQAVELAKAILAEPALRLDGLMGYEAQIAGLQDRVPGKGLINAVVRALKRSSIREISARRGEAVAGIEALGRKLRLVNGGGTGSLESTREEPWVTEVTAGSGFYSPGLFDHFTNFKHRPSAGFAIEITRCPQPGLYTCHGGGYIASGAAGRDRLPIPWMPEGAALLPVEGAGEVQTPFVYSGPERLSLGDPFFLRHAKAGELCERFKTLMLVSEGKIVDEVATYRGDGECFV
jgi:D-serine deaminase-like pyridoxal phosphate-dependent protein